MTVSLLSTFCWIYPPNQIAFWIQIGSAAGMMGRLTGIVGTAQRRSAAVQTVHRGRTVRIAKQSPRRQIFAPESNDMTRVIFHSCLIYLLHLTFTFGRYKDPLICWTRSREVEIFLSFCKAKSKYITENSVKLFCDFRKAKGSMTKFGNYRCSW